MGSMAPSILGRFVQKGWANGKYAILGSRSLRELGPHAFALPGFPSAYNRYLSIPILIESIDKSPLARPH